MKTIAYASILALLVVGCKGTQEPRRAARKTGVDFAKEGIAAGKDVKVVTIDGKELLHMPRVHFTAHSLDIGHEFYEYRDGKLVRVPTTSE
jgi:hypothetical protein